MNPTSLVAGIERGKLAMFVVSESMPRIEAEAFCDRLQRTNPANFFVILDGAKYAVARPVASVDDARDWIKIKRYQDRSSSAMVSRKQKETIGNRVTVVMSREDVFIGDRVWATYREQQIDIANLLNGAGL